MSMNQFFILSCLVSACHGGRVLRKFEPDRTFEPEKAPKAVATLGQFLLLRSPTLAGRTNAYMQAHDWRSLLNSGRSYPRNIGMLEKFDPSTEIADTLDDGHALAQDVGLVPPSYESVRPPVELLESLASVWVLVFDFGQPSEGVYTIADKREQESSARTRYVVAFEYEHDAKQHTENVFVANYDRATPVQWNTAFLKSFCRDRGFAISLVPKGGHVTYKSKFPTSINVPGLSAFAKNDDRTLAEDVGLLPYNKVSKERAYLEHLFSLSVGDDEK